MKNIQICSKCIYDITVPSIKFDEQGICNYCHMVDDLIDEYGTGKAKGQEIFQSILDENQTSWKEKTI